MKQLLYLAVLLVALNFSVESCEMIKFKHKSTKPDFYERLEGKTCNGEPIFKMLGDVFFIYKSANNKYWCESYTPSKLVICDAECDEIRLDMENLYSPEGITPEEYNGHFNEWIQLTDDLVTCNDHNILNDVFVHDSSTNIDEATNLQNLEKLEEAKDMKNDKNEQKLDSLMEKIKEFQSNGLLEPSNTTVLTTSTTTISTSTIPLVTSKQDQAAEDKYILSMVSDILPKLENERLSKTLSDLTQSVITSTTTPRTIGRVTNLPKMPQPSSLSKTKTPISLPNFDRNDRLSSILSKYNSTKRILPMNNIISVKKQDILNNRDNSCTRIVLEIYDESVKESSLVFDLVADLNCLNYPIYKSGKMFLFRNVYGEWCQKNELATFEPSTECFRKCKTILLGPGMIQSPVETTLVTLFDLENQINGQLTNHRYVCKTFSSCESVTCKNGGECITSDETTRTTFTCKCPFYSTGRFCEQIIDKCFSSPCLNNGTCVSKPFQEPKCRCVEGFTGSMCEKEVFKCKYNPCFNGGRCVGQITDTEFVCECPLEYKGNFCEVPALESCHDKLFGQTVAHPDDTKQFLVCLQGGRYQLSPCPKGLVFNTHLSRCDYSTEKETNLDANVCQTDQPCLNDGVCFFPAFNSTDDYFCECKQGFAGKNCESNIDDCQRGQTQCGEDNICVDLIDSFMCLCENNKFYGSDCSEKKIEIPCTESSLQITRYSYPFDKSLIVECDNNGRLSLKNCPKGLEWDPFKAACMYPKTEVARMSTFNGLKCLSVDCQNGASCVVDENEEAKCVCAPGYEGDLCEINTDECASNPCLNNGRCVDGVNKYHCVCENKYIDKDCCCVNYPNPCGNVLNEFQAKKDKTVRYPHPFTAEKFIVCNLEGFAQVIDCPEGLVWKQDEETCALKNNHIQNVYKQFCNSLTSDIKLSYPYSQLKYAKCLDNNGYELFDCDPTSTPYFCAKNSVCVSNLNTECKNAKRN